MTFDSDAVLIAVATITAIATSFSAFVSWRIWKGRVFPEWEYHWSGSEGDRELSVRVNFRNNTDSTFEANSVEIRKFPILGLYSGKKLEEKHESWGLRRAPLGYGEILPSSQKSFSFHIQPDWLSLETNPSKRLVTRSICDAPLRIQVTLISKLSRRRIIKFNTKTKIPVEMINNEARAIYK